MQNEYNNQFFYKHKQLLTMKKVLLLTALVLGAASCQKDFTADVESRGEVDVQLAVAAPELIGATRTDGDAHVKYYQQTFGGIYRSLVLQRRKTYTAFDAPPEDYRHHGQFRQDID